MEPKKNEWRSWIDLQPPVQSPGGTLYVTGQIHAGDEKIQYDLAKASPQGTNTKELILEVLPSPTKGSVEIELRYEEKLDQKDKHTSVRVRVEGRPDIVISEIEITQ